MVCKLRLCKATQSASASASATVNIASTSTASCSPKINVDVIGSKPSASPNGLGRSPTIAFPGAVKTLTLSVFDATVSVMFAVSVMAAGCSAHGCSDSARESIKPDARRLVYWTNVSNIVVPETKRPASQAGRQLPIRRATGNLLGESQHDCITVSAPST